MGKWRQIKAISLDDLTVMAAPAPPRPGRAVLCQNKTQFDEPAVEKLDPRQRQAERLALFASAWPDHRPAVAHPVLGPGQGEQVIHGDDDVAPEPHVTGSALEGGKQMTGQEPLL